MLTKPARILRQGGVTRGLLFSGFLSCLSLPAIAQDSAEVEPAGFAECKARLQEQAIAAGVSSKIASEVMSGATGVHHYLCRLPEPAG